MSKIIMILQTEMVKPTMYGWFHLMWLTFAIILLLTFRIRNKYDEKQLKIILLVYGIVAFILEALKQLSWAATVDPITKVISWHYSWYSAPFQLCTMPIYISLIAAFLKKGQLRDSLLSFMAFFTILGSIATAFYPVTVFVPDILINIHTMYLHIGSLVVSIYIVMSQEIEIKNQNLFKGYIVFLICAIIAQVLNFTIYNSGILNGETFNMFFISPYFPCTLPVFNMIYDKVPYIVFILLYLLAIYLGGFIIYLFIKLIRRFRHE